MTEVETPFPSAIDLVIYINLDKRPDRRAEIEHQFERVGIPKEKILRWPGVVIQGNGPLGVSLSHVGVLEHIQTLPDSVQNILIFEDDFDFESDVSMVNKSLTKFLTYPRDLWDMVLLSYAVHRRQDYDDLVSIAYESYMCSGFMINRRAAPKILANFREGCQGLMATGWSPYFCDNYWHRLMQTGRCFYFNKSLGFQRYSYSDNCNETLARLSRVV